MASIDSLTLGAEAPATTSRPSTLGWRALPLCALAARVLGEARLAGAARPPRRRALTLHRASREALEKLSVDVVLQCPLPVGPKLLVARPQSVLDPWLLAGVVPCLPVLPRTAERWPLLGPVAASVGAVFVDEDSPGSEALRKVARLLRAGVSVLVFPETGAALASADATRPAAFARGPFAIARELETPIVPLQVGPFPAFAPTRLDSWRGLFSAAAQLPPRVTVRVGVPFVPSESETAEKAAARARAEVLALRAG